MASQTIPGLPAATTVSGTEQIWAVQNGTDVRLTVAQVFSAVLGSIPNVQRGDPIPASGNIYINSSGFLVVAQ